MASVERGGVASAYLNGAYVSVDAKIKVKHGGVVRTPIVSSDQVVGYSTKIEPPEVDLDAIDGPQVSVLALKAISGQTLQVKLNNGKTVMLYDAFQVADPTEEVDAAKVTGVKFSGSRTNELMK